MPKNNRSVECELDPGSLPPLTKHQRAELEALRKSSDVEINYSDIPALSGAFWKNATRLQRKAQRTTGDVGN
jgi:hypothetical protein